VQFVTTFKSQQFVFSGALPALRLAWTVTHCLSLMVA
jgi:hypothetical protein